MLTMFQPEAMWLNIHSAFISDHETNYPFAVRIAAGKVDALTGEEWTNGIHGAPQDYLVVPEQPWLDGFCLGKGIIRQFVEMPLGEGYTAEKQITGSVEHGGLQIIVYPMKHSAFESRFPKLDRIFASEMAHPYMCESMKSAEMGLVSAERDNDQEEIAGKTDPGGTFLGILKILTGGDLRRPAGASLAKACWHPPAVFMPRRAGRRHGIPKPPPYGFCRVA